MLLAPWCNTLQDYSSGLVTLKDSFLSRKSYCEEKSIIKDGLDNEQAAGVDVLLDQWKGDADINMVSDFTAEGLC